MGCLLGEWIQTTESFAWVWMEGWQVGRLESWKVGRLEGWLEEGRL